MFLEVSILVLAFLIGTLIFGDSPTFRNTPLHKVFSFLLAFNSAAVKHIRTNKTLFTILKWLIPFFYVVVVYFCFYEFFVAVYPELNKQNIIGLGHKTGILLTVAFIIISTLLAFFSDPGVLHRADLAANLRKFPNDGLIFFGRECSTCGWKKPARSKHCSLCNQCVVQFDHHCIWINNCVGQNNYKWFLTYLLANIFMMMYGAYLCWRLLDGQEASRGLWNLIASTTYSNKVAGILSILGVIFSFISLAFTALHIRYMYLGVTTNEADKWGEIEYLIELRALFFARDLGMYLERASLGSNGVFQVVYISLDDELIIITENNKQCHNLIHLSLVAELTNIYDKGFWNNVYDRICGC